MASPLTEKIQDLLSKYLSGERTLQEFDESFIQAAWDVGGPLDTETAALRGEILLLLAEYTSGHRSESEVKEILMEIVRENALT